MRYIYHLIDDSGFKFITEYPDLGIGHYEFLSPPDEVMKAHSRNSSGRIVAKTTKRKLRI